MFNTLFTGKPTQWLQNVDSTNHYASKAFKDNAVTHGKVFATHQQTAGRGQANTVWQSKPGDSLTFSLVYMPTMLAANQQFYLNIAVCLAIVKYLETEHAIEATIKWPNDIYVGYDKIAGILIENSVRGQNLQATIIGIGLNVNESAFSDDIVNATSIYITTKKISTIEDELAKLLFYLEQQYLQLQSLNFKEMKTDYLERLLFLNIERLYSIDNSLKTATILDVYPTGQLVAAVANEGTRHFNFKEIGFVV